LKKKIDIPEPIHPSEEEATGNNNENDHPATLHPTIWIFHLLTHHNQVTVI